VHYRRVLQQWPEGHPVRSTAEIGGFLDDIDKVDWRSLRVSPRDAASMDPQHRLMLEVSWEAMEDAGFAWEEIAGANAAVYVGIFTNDYFRMQSAHSRRIDGYTAIGGVGSYVANRISYKFDLRGPSMAIDTACASSLTAVHEAVRWLQSGEGEFAVAGGVSMMVSPEISIALATAGILSPTGQCRHLDASANGFVRTEGAGAVVLKRLADVRPDDRVYAVIRGTATNHNGYNEWIMATNPEAQEQVFRRACEAAAVNPKDVDFVEFHGTGTKKGDPIEARSVGNVYGQGRARPCLVGSVKSIIGHLDTAAGVMGLSKTALALFHGAIPPNRHFESINPDIPLAELGIEPVTTLRPWPRTEGSRLAAVSAFGLGGSNVHAVLEGAPSPAARGSVSPSPGASSSSASPARPFVLPLSARSSRATLGQAATWVSWLRQASDEQARDACYTAAVRRTHHEHRLVAVAASRDELASQLEALALSKPSSLPQAQALSPASLAFVFTGQGAQYVGMARRLLATEPVFRAAFEDMDRRCVALAGWSLIEAVTAEPDAESLARGLPGRLAQTEVAQPVMFAMQVALVRLLAGFGIEPAMVLGHSLGEIAAAHVCGALDLDAALRLAIARGRCMQAATGTGRMLAVELSIDEAREVTAAFDLEIASHNGPKATVLCGATERVESAAASLRQRGTRVHMLPVDYAFHSRQMEPFAAELERTLGKLSLQSGSIPLVSTVTGEMLAGTELGPAYWAAQMRGMVRFADAVASASRAGATLFLEIGPHAALSQLVDSTLRAIGAAGAGIGLLNREADEQRELLAAVGRLHTRGFPVAWERIIEARRVTSTPTYAWQRERMWLDWLDKAPKAASRHPIVGRRISMAHLPGHHVWEGEISVEAQPWMADHGVQGSLIVVGTTCLELVSSGWASLGHQGPCELLDVRFVTAFHIEEGVARRLQLVFEPGEGAATYRFAYFSRPAEDENGPATLHIRGTVRASKRAPEAPRPRTLAGESMSGRALYEILEKAGNHYGPTFQGLTRVAIGSQEAVGEVRVPTALQDDLEGYLFHPAVLDSCAHMVVVAAGLPGGAKMPVRMDRVVIHAPQTREMYAHARVRSTGGGESPYVVGDVQVTSGDGKVLAELEGVRVHLFHRPLWQASRTEEAPLDWLYRLRWLPAEPVAPGRSGQRWLLLGSAPQALAQALREAGHESERSNDLDRIGAQPWTGVVYVASPGDGAAGAVRECKQLMLVAQRLLAAPTAGRLRVLTHGATSVRAGAPDPAQAAIWGLGIGFGLEHPDRWGGLVDLEADLPLERIAGELTSQGADAPAEDRVAHTSSGRFVQRLIRAEAPIHGELNTRGSWVVTGGSGALGLRVGLWLARAGVRDITLVSRSGLPERSAWASVSDPAVSARIADVMAMERAGATVRVIAADVGDASAMSKVLDTPLPLVGIVHAAGIAPSKAIASLDEPGLTAVLRAKCDGAWNLHQLTRGRDVELVFFSSVASAWGSAGLAAYGAGNAFLDALAWARRAEGGRAVSIHWGPWAGGGMASEEFLNDLSLIGTRGMAPAPAMACLARIVGSPETEIVVADVEWSRFRAIYEARPGRGLLRALADTPRSEQAQPAAPARQATTRDLVALLRAAAAVELGLRPEQIDPATSLRDLGFNSLMAVALHTRLREEHGVEVPVARLIEGLPPATLAAMAEAPAAPAPREAGPSEGVLGILRTEIARELDLKIEDLPVDVPVRDLGFNSLMAVAVHERLLERGLNLQVARLIEGPPVAVLENMARPVAPESTGPREAPAANVADAAAATLRKEVATELGLTPEQLDSQIPLRDLGFNSLMAVALHQRLIEEHGITLPVARLIEGPSIVALVPMIDTSRPSQGEEETPKSAPAASPAVASLPGPAELLRAAAARELAIPANALDPGVPLKELGFNSLMAVSLHERLRDEHGIVIPVARLIEGLPLVVLSSMIQKTGD
jgi:myxalamid-type polyketide synthase MxaE and MxaD